MKTLTWSQLCPAGTASGQIRKHGCGIVQFHHDKCAMIGEYGIPTDTTQPGSLLIRSTKYTDGRGWTSEFHMLLKVKYMWTTIDA